LTLVVPSLQAAHLRGDPRKFALQVLADFPEVNRRVGRLGLTPEVMVTGPFDRPVRRPWAPGAVLVGDAAGYYDPFTGQGIHQALFSARLAAEAVEEALADRALEPAALTCYARRLARDLIPKRGLQRLIEHVVSRPKLMSRFVRVLAAGDGELGGRLLRATGDVAHPATLLAPDVWLRLAYRLATGSR